tara:strand:- start:3097 stop:3321 length:225 start_codon:yes stop_codon:yes gene_type:complete
MRKHATKANLKLRSNLRENRRNDNLETLVITHYCGETAGGLEGMPIKAKKAARTSALILESTARHGVELIKRTL